MYLTKEVCAELKYARIKNKIKAIDVANKLGKSCAWLCKIESGEIKTMDDSNYQLILDLYGIKNGYAQTEIYKLNEKIRQLEEENKDLRKLLRWYMPTR